MLTSYAVNYSESHKDRTIEAKTFDKLKDAKAFCAQSSFSGYVLRLTFAHSLRGAKKVDYLFSFGGLRLALANPYALKTCAHMTRDARKS